MGLFRKIFTNKKDSKVEKSNSEKSNPSFEYVKDNYNIDCDIYRKLSQSIHASAYSAAKQFAKLLNSKPNEDVVHFFFDYFLFFFSVARRQSLPKENDAYSAIIDGVHLEYYGNVNQYITDNTIKLMTIKEFCFLKTNYRLYEKKDLRMSITIAAYCVLKPKLSGATEILALTDQFRLIHKEKLSSIDNAFEIFRTK